MAVTVLLLFLLAVSAASADK
ncbi:hypothetical protein CISIN_1g0108332mg, partial [Citrus sinensis]